LQPFEIFPCAPQQTNTGERRPRYVIKVADKVNEFI
jgi:hypothetical protein